MCTILHLDDDRRELGILSSVDPGQARIQVQRIYEPSDSERWAFAQVGEIDARPRIDDDEKLGL